MAMTPDEVREMVLSFPQTEEGTAYGQAAYKAFGKFLTRIRKEEMSLVLVGVEFDERDFLMEADPQTFFITPHYQNYPSVLARLSHVAPGTVRNFIERRWRACAPKKFLKAYDAGNGPAGDAL